MSVYAEMVNSKKKVIFGEDTVVIRHLNSSITGGRTLDVSDFTGDDIKAGHLVIRKKDSDGVYTYSPLGVSDGAYVALPEGAEYAGVVISSMPKDEPVVGIMDDGRVNDIAMPYPLTDEMRTALKTALPNLIFEHD